MLYSFFATLGTRNGIFYNNKYYIFIAWGSEIKYELIKKNRS